MSDGLAIGALSVAAAAFALSVYTLFANRRQNRRDLFLSLHEKLTHPDLQTGRTLLRERINSHRDAARMRRWRPDDYRLVASAIAMFDILGLYVQKRFVDEELVFAEWGWLCVEVYDHGRHVVEERRRNGTGQAPWPHFQDLGVDAAEWVNSQNRSGMR